MIGGGGGIEISQRPSPDELRCPVNNGMLFLVTVIFDFVNETLHVAEIWKK